MPLTETTLRCNSTSFWNSPAQLSQSDSLRKDIAPQHCPLVLHLVWLTSLLFSSFSLPLMISPGSTSKQISFTQIFMSGYVLGELTQDKTFHLYSHFNAPTPSKWSTLSLLQTLHSYSVNSRTWGHI